MADNKKISASTRRSELFKQVKVLAKINKVDAGVYWGNATIASLEKRVRELDIVNEEFKFEEKDADKLKTRTYRIIKPTKPSEDSAGKKITVPITFMEIDLVKPLINKRIAHALRTGITAKANMHVSFTVSIPPSQDEIEEAEAELLFGPRPENTIAVITFNAFQLSDLDRFYKAYKKKMAEGFGQTGSGLTAPEILEIKILIVKEKAGGCNGTKHAIVKHIKDVIHTTPISANNNCLFSCVWDYVDLYGSKRLGRVIANRVRAEYNLEEEALIPISIALKIFDQFKKNKDDTLVIIDEDTKMEYPEFGASTDATVILVLKKEHYSIVSLKDVNKCKECGKNYRKAHTCNEKNKSYYHKKITKKDKSRCLLASKNEETSNNKDFVIHYDLETHQVKVGDTDHVEHITYIVGFTNPLKQMTFDTFAGDNCITDFVSFLIDYAAKLEEQAKKDKKKKPIVYVNAYNGANFDHFPLFKEFLRRGITPDSHIINNGSIIKFEYKNLKLFDLCKHLQGSLKANLKALNCEVQKGDFNHEKGSRWEDMIDTDRAECLLYLRGDVMGLKELYDKINTQIYNENKVNITSFMSTSSLTFALWRENVCATEHVINLPTLKQEEGFRQSVRGGRTYKSKHSFNSKQYEAYLNGECKFEDVNDYITDADVVSLYPTAMAHFEYPVGECYELKAKTTEELLVEGENQLMGKMGIYKISYTPNKNIQHSIGGRRNENGALKWDLKDSDGWYTSVDIQDMIDNKYEVKIHSGWYWTKTAFIFKEYIEKLFQDKADEAAKGNKGSAKYMLCKLFMNGLYGKQIQRPIYDSTVIIKDSTEYWKHWATNVIKDITRVSMWNDDEAKKEDVWFVTSCPRDVVVLEGSITKPTQLGAFILAYSRRIMLNYIKESNPHFEVNPNSASYLDDLEKQKENDFYYTDTDSLQMHNKNAKLMKNLGNQNLGGITDDLGNSCKIIRGIWIAPKLYALEYITADSREPLKPHEKNNRNIQLITKTDANGNITTTKIHHHFRGKGLNVNQLCIEEYEKMSRGEKHINVREFQFKKINITKNSKQQNVGDFSILHLKNIKKTVNETKWEGRQFEEGSNVSSPWK